MRYSRISHSARKVGHRLKPPVDHAATANTPGVITHLIQSSGLGKIRYEASDRSALSSSGCFRVGWGRRLPSGLVRKFSAVSVKRTRPRTVPCTTAQTSVPAAQADTTAIVFL